MRFVEAADGGDVGRIVRGEERVDFLHRAQHGLVEHLRAGDAARHHRLEADRRESAESAERFLDERDGRAVVGQ